MYSRNFSIGGVTSHYVIIFLFDFCLKMVFLAVSGGLMTSKFIFVSNCTKFYIRIFSTRSSTRNFEFFVLRILIFFCLRARSGEQLFRKKVLYFGRVSRIFGIIQFLIFRVNFKIAKARILFILKDSSFVGVIFFLKIIFMDRPIKKSTLFFSFTI